MGWPKRTGGTAAPQESAQDRDARLEGSYTFHRNYPYESLTAYVSVERDTIAQAFFDWTSKGQAFGAGSTNEQITQFEEERFGRALEPVAHAMLAFAIRAQREHMRRPDDSVFPSEEAREAVEAVVLALPPIEGEGMEDKLRRIAVASGLMLPEEPKRPLAHILRRVPEAPVPPEQREVRLPYRDSDNDAPTPPEGSSASEGAFPGAALVSGTPSERVPGEDDDDEPTDWLEEIPEEA